jgi:hypothetical protein
VYTVVAALHRLQAGARAAVEPGLANVSGTELKLTVGEGRRSQEPSRDPPEALSFKEAGAFLLAPRGRGRFSPPTDQRRACRALRNASRSASLRSATARPGIACAHTIFQQAGQRGAHAELDRHAGHTRCALLTRYGEKCAGHRKRPPGGPFEEMLEGLENRQANGAPREVPLVACHITSGSIGAVKPTRSSSSRPSKASMYSSR